MKRILFVVLSCIFCACSSADVGNVVEPTGEQSQNLTTDFVTNQSKVISQPLGTFWHPTLFGGTDAHSQAPIYTWGIPGYGGFGAIGAASTSTTRTLSAWPNSAHQSPAGLFTMIVQRDPIAILSPDFLISYSNPGAPTPRSGSVDLWTTNAICWINGAGHLSHAGEKVELVTVNDGSWPTGWRWRLTVNGTAALMGQAQCAGLVADAAYYPNYSWYTATPGHPASGLFPSQGMCFIYKIVGDLDNGSVRWHTGTFFGNYELAVDGGVSEARGFCVTFP